MTEHTGELGAVDNTARRVSMPMSVEVHDELMAWREATADARQAALDGLAALCSEHFGEEEPDGG